MENASKALLIAAAVLVVIIIITFGIKIYTSSSDAGKAATDTGKTLSDKTEKSTDLAIHEITTEISETPEECFKWSNGTMITGVNKEKLPENIKIPSRATEIRGGFDGCDKLKSIIVPNNVKLIGDYSFRNCSNLESVILPDNTLKNIGYGAFIHCEKLKNITIPNGVTSLGGLAFYHCDNLENVTLPSSLTFIGYQSFCGCKNLK